MRRRNLTETRASTISCQPRHVQLSMDASHPSRSPTSSNSSTSYCAHTKPSRSDFLGLHAGPVASSHLPLSRAVGPSSASSSSEPWLRFNPGPLRHAGVLANKIPGSRLDT
jgi:hypothetical protein